MVHAQEAQEVAFFVRPGRDVDFGANPFGELDGGNAYPAGGTVDEHFFTGLQSRQMAQGVIDREEGAGNGRR